MNLAWWLTNLVEYSLQAALLAVVGGVLLYSFRIRDPGVRLPYWQFLLTACLVLPFVQPWQSMSSVSYSVAAVEGPVAARVVYPLRLEELLALVLLAGFVVRLSWLSIGLVRLRRYRRDARPWANIPSWVAHVQSSVGVTARICVSPVLDGPVTFGLRRPVILLPTRFERMSREVQEAILCHELLHVRRKDWIWTLFEELLRCVFWFHPAIAWLVGRTQLAREQVVDRLAVRTTGSRDSYLEALMIITEVRMRPTTAAAPAFLRRRQLAHRVELLLKEDLMSRFRLTCFLGAVLPLLLVAGCFAVSTFPLRAAAQEEPASSKERIYKVGKDGVSTPSLVHRVEPTYTKEARDAGLEGTVVLSVVVGPDDRTHDMEVLSRVGMGLDQQAVDAVKQWRFEPARKDGEPVAIQATIEVNFRLMDDLEEEDANGKPQPQETKK